MCDDRLCSRHLYPFQTQRSDRKLNMDYLMNIMKRFLITDNREEKVIKYSKHLVRKLQMIVLFGQIKTYLDFVEYFNVYPMFKTCSASWCLSFVLFCILSLRIHR